MLERRRWRRTPLTSGSNRTVDCGIGGAERADNEDVMARTGVDLRVVEDGGETGVVVTGADMASGGCGRRVTLTLTSGMFFDLNFPVLGVGQSGQPSKRGNQAGVVYNAAQLNAIESRLDILAHCESTISRIQFVESQCDGSRIHRRRFQPDRAQKSREEDSYQRPGPVAEATTTETRHGVFETVDDHPR
jgi:hypothetical protein